MKSLLSLKTEKRALSLISLPFVCSLKFTSLKIPINMCICACILVLMGCVILYIATLFYITNTSIDTIWNI